MQQPRLRQPWIGSSVFDLCFIVGPAFLVTAGVVLFRHEIADIDGTPPWLWLLLVVGVDVSHVYSTIFRTYLDKEELRKRQMLYTLVPLAAWIAGVLLYNISGLAFWRVLAYLAVFHFMRQQYGFMMLYARGERARPSWTRRLDQAAIYLSTLFPILYWHVNHRAFSWFIDGDFIALPWPQLGVLSGAVFVLVMLAYVAKETVFSWREKQVNLPKNLLLAGTALSWGVGIVIFNSDLAFTATNVIAHGIPYMALIWIYGRNQGDMGRAPYIAPVFAKFFSLRALPFFIALLFTLAFLEEGLWDGFVWRDHAGLFGLFSRLPTVTSADIMAWLVPLLALPQAVHYVLDAFIWKHDLKDSEWKRILLYQKPTAG